MSQRIAKVEEALKEAVALILQREVKDPGVALVTVTRVRMTADLQHAVIYFSVLGPEGDRAAVEAGLGRACPYVRRLVGQRLRLRLTPELRFQYDPSVAESIRLQQLIREQRDKRQVTSDPAHPESGHPSQMAHNEERCSDGPSANGAAAPQMRGHDSGGAG